MTRDFAGLGWPPVRPRSGRRLVLGLGRRAEAGAGVVGGADRSPPPVVGEVPVDGGFETALKSVGGAPAELGFDLGGVNGVAPVVAGAVGDEADELAVVSPPCPRPPTIEDGADRLDDLKVGALGAAADVVALAHNAASQHGLERGGVVLDMEPVADIGAGAVDGQLAFVEGIEDGERDQLFGEVERAVIVGEFERTAGRP